MRALFCAASSCTFQRHLADAFAGTLSLVVKLPPGLRLCLSARSRSRIDAADVKGDESAKNLIGRAASCAKFSTGKVRLKRRDAGLYLCLPGTSFPPRA